MPLYVALDVGTKTIGVATAGVEAQLPTPRFTLARQSVAKDVAELIDRMDDVAEWVVGLPYLPSGDEGRSAKLARQIGVALGEATGLPVHYQDETLSSVEAEERLREAGHRSRRIKELVDSWAAAVILEDWLNERL